MNESELIQQDFILLIMNCKKYRKKAKYQKKTWLKNLPSYLPYYHVIGHEELEKEYKFDENKRILWLKVADDYNSLPKKVILAYEIINKTFNYKYLLKTDDDQMLINSNFFNILKLVIQDKTPVIHYGGYIVNVKTPHFSKYHLVHPELPENIPVYATKYCNGRFYFLSKDAVVDLISKKINICKEYFEDYAIGYHLSDTYKKNIFNIDSNQYFIDMIL
jgi:hypothetical protein